MRITQIQPVVLPGNIGTVETISIILTVDDFTSNSDVKIRYSLGTLSNDNLQIHGFLPMSFEVYTTMATNKSAILEWVCEQLGISLVTS